MPGVPSLYYGSEWGLPGRRTPTSDTALRPAIDVAALAAEGDGLLAPPAGQAVRGAGRDLARAIARRARVRGASPALRHGDYRPLKVDHRQLIYCRQAGEECVIVALNAAQEPVALEVPVPVGHGTRLADLLAPGESWPISGGTRGRSARVDPVWPNWLRVLAVR
jgi:glycosidase